MCHPNCDWTCNAPPTLVRCFGVLLILFCSLVLVHKAIKYCRCATCEGGISPSTPSAFRFRRLKKTSRFVCSSYLFFVPARLQAFLLLVQFICYDRYVFLYIIIFLLIAIVFMANKNYRNPCRCCFLLWFLPSSFPHSGVRLSSFQ